MKTNTNARMIWIYAIMLLVLGWTAVGSAGSYTSTLDPKDAFYAIEGTGRALVDATSVSSEDLKKSLYKILKSSHVQKAGELDLLVESCAKVELKEGETCRERKTLGYKLARTHIFGAIDLKQKEDGEYYLRDVYCLKDFTKADFKPGQVAPGPLTIPEHTVINAEHTWPQSRFNMNEVTVEQLSDVHHLFPSESKTNGIRGNLMFGTIDRATGKEQNCKGNWRGAPVSIHGIVPPTAEAWFEPPNEHKGNVARALFYFAVRYRADIHPLEEINLRDWDKLDPIDAAEVTRNEETYKIQGNRNPFIDYPTLVDRISDFRSADYKGGKGGGSSEEEEPKTPTEPKPTEPKPPTTPKPPTSSSGPLTEAELEVATQLPSIHIFENGVLSLLNEKGEFVRQIENVVEARRNSCFGVSGAPFKTYEIFARTVDGTLYKITADKDRSFKTERLSDPSLSLLNFMIQKKINCKVN